MEIQYCSDLHLEFPQNREYLKKNPVKPVGEILLLAGDIVPFSGLDAESGFFDFLSDHFEQTYWVPGNHEYYRSEISARSGKIHEKIRANVSLVNNTVLRYKGWRLIFSTLWSRISPEKEEIIRRSMADFRLIRNHGKKLTIDDYNQLHAQCLEFLSRELSNGQGQNTIVVSHHVPTFFNYPAKYRESDLNQGFAVELFDLIELSRVNYWIFGHTHEVVGDFMIGNTILTTNQLGYVEYSEHINFRRDKTIAG